MAKVRNLENYEQYVNDEFEIFAKSINNAVEEIRMGSGFTPEERRAKLQYLGIILKHLRMTTTAVCLSLGTLPKERRNGGEK